MPLNLSLYSRNTGEILAYGSLLLLLLVVFIISPLCFLPQVPKAQPVALITSPEDSQHYEEARQCVEELALYLKPLSNTRGT